MTIPKGSIMKKIDLDKIKKAFTEKGFEILERGKREMKIEKEMTIGQVIKAKPASAGILMNYGMHCLGCPASLAETLEEASVVHDIDIRELIEELKKAE